jgi:hypothetical protein
MEAKFSEVAPNWNIYGEVAPKWKKYSEQEWKWNKYAKITRKLKTRSEVCKIGGFYSSDYEEWRLLGCYAVWLL